MFADWLWEKLAADYERRILAIDPDDVITRSGLEPKLKRHGFQIVDVEALGPIQFRYHYEVNYGKEEKKVIFLVRSDDAFVPYDVRKQCYEVNLSFETLFPKLDVNVLRRAKSLDLSLLYAASRNDFGGRRGEEDTWLFLKQEMYSPENADEYARWLIGTIEERLTTCRHYTDWFHIAEEWAKLRLLFDGGFTRQRIDTLLEKIENHFCKWLMVHYQRLSASFHSQSPVMLHKTNDYMRTKANKLALIVVDGMSLANWLVFSQADFVPGFSYEQSYAFALIPTITSVSRLALFSGKLPVEMAKPFALANEEKEWRAYWRKYGYSNHEIIYSRDSAYDPLPSVKVVGIIVNMIDNMMHGQVQGQAGMFRDITAWSQSGELQALILRLLKKGFSVFLTSDHGNTESVGFGRPPNEGVLTELAGERCRIYQEYAEIDRMISDQTHLFPPIYLPKQYKYVLAKERLCFHPRGKIVVCHGGMSIEEVIVPFIRIKGADSM